MSGTISVLLFGPHRAAAGAERIDVPVDRLPTHGDVLRQAIADGYPALAPSVSSCRIAVNLEYTDDASPIQAGDEVALIAPVSGG